MTATYHPVQRQVVDVASGLKRRALGFKIPKTSNHLMEFYEKVAQIYLASTEIDSRSPGGDSFQANEDQQCVGGGTEPNSDWRIQPWIQRAGPVKAGTGSLDEPGELPAGQWAAEPLPAPGCHSPIRTGRSLALHVDLPS